MGGGVKLQARGARFAGLILQGRMERGRAIERDLFFPKSICMFRELVVGVLWTDEAARQSGMFLQNTADYSKTVDSRRRKMRTETLDPSCLQAGAHCLTSA